MTRIHIRRKMLALGWRVRHLFSNRKHISATELVRAPLSWNQTVQLRKIDALGKALAKALEDSRHASTWPGDRLPVSQELSEKVEELTRRLQRETEAFARA